MAVEAIHWKVPHGCVGLMGWRLTSGGAQVVPKNQGAWIVADGESERWELEGLHESGRWEVTGYNLGNQPHTVTVRFHVRPIRPRQVLPRLLTAAELAEVPDLSRARSLPARP